MVGAGHHSSGAIEAEDLAAGEAEEGMGVVVRKQVGVGGEVALSPPVATEPRHLARGVPP